MAVKHTNTSHLGKNCNIKGKRCRKLLNWTHRAMDECVDLRDHTWVVWSLVKKLRVIYLVFKCVCDLWTRVLRCLCFYWIWYMDVIMQGLSYFDSDICFLILILIYCKILVHKCFKFGIIKFFWLTSLYFTEIPILKSSKLTQASCIVTVSASGIRRILIW